MLSRASVFEGFPQKIVPRKVKLANTDLVSGLLDLLVTKIGSQDHRLASAVTKIASLTSKLLLLVAIHKCVTFIPDSPKQIVLDQPLVHQLHNMSITIKPFCANMISAKLKANFQHLLFCPKSPKNDLGNKPIPPAEEEGGQCNQGAA